MNWTDTQNWLDRLRPSKSSSNGDISKNKKNANDAEICKKPPPDGDTADSISLRSSYSNRSVHSLKDEQVI